MVAGSVLGIVTAVVLHNLLSGWLVTGVLVRDLGLSMGDLGCWGLEVVGDGRHFSWALIVDLAVAVVVGIAMAQLATWTFWPSGCRAGRRCSTVR